jgi:type I restriction enzyme S subunit
MNVKRGILDWSGGEAKRWPDADPGLAEYALRLGDIVIAMDGLVGRSNARITEADLPAYLVQRVARLRAEAMTDQSFLYHLVASASFARHCWSRKTGTTISHISKADIEEFEIPRFGLPAEQRLGRLLDLAERAQQLTDALIAAKREQKRGLMQQLLTGKVRFPGFTEPWRMAHLGDFVDLDRGVTYARETDLRAPGSAGCVRLLRATNVQDGQIVMNDVHHIDARRSSSSDLLTAGDLVICIANGSKHLVGKHAIATSEVCIEPTVVGAFCARARPRAGVRPAFVAALMESRAYRRWIGALLAGTNINNLKPNDIASAPLHVPTSWSEVEKITRTYEVANREIRILETQREAFATQRRGLMERLLSGEIDIPSSDTSAA